MTKHRALALIPLFVRTILGVGFEAVFISPVPAAAPLFTLQGPGVRGSDFRVTTFASGLSFPLGMARLSDGSLLVAVSPGTSFTASTGQLIRLVDIDRDGVADGPGSVLFDGLPGGQTSLRVAGALVFVTGQGRGKPISILRMGPAPGDRLLAAGKITIVYPSGSWLHPHSALAVRNSPRGAASYDLIFQLGSEMNFARSTRTASLSTENLGGLTGTLAGDSIYMLTITDQKTNLVASNLLRIASGLRNPAGFAFEPQTGDFYFQDNGIDGLVDPNEPTSADELNRIPAADFASGPIENFGFPQSYIEYRTGKTVGGAGIQPLVAFQPLPDPLTGEESEGPNDIAFAPPAFPDGLNSGIFLGFHGRFNAGGVTNEENPLVYVDLPSTRYFHFVGVNEPRIGHLDGVLATEDSLFLADLTSNGNLSKGGGMGIIYQIKSLRPPAFSLNPRHEAGALELDWSHGILQKADRISGPWADVPAAVHPYLVEPEDAAAFFRIRN